ncbi:polymerase, nucleotidyl transferase domain [Phytophthora cactorum]|nr:polymerase, nucleotidyl transferase domain [Phytophthora cactorum]
MARTKAQGRKAKSAGRDVYVEGKKAAAERKKVKAKIKAKGKVKHAAKMAKEEKKRQAREAAAPPNHDEADDGFIEFAVDEDGHRKSSKKKEDPQKEEKRVLQLESRPWMRQRKGYVNRNVYECLHDEIMDFVTFISPTEDEVSSRAQLVQEMRDIVKGLWPEATVETFGSHYTQMFLPQSDIDMVLFGVPEGKEPLFKLAQCLEEKDLVSYLEVIDKARIPIVKMVHKESDIHVDVSFNHYMRVYPSFRPLTLVLKYFMAQRGLNETYSGGVGSFLLQMMVVSFFSITGVRWLLVGFFTLYGRDFNYTELGISVRNGKTPLVRRWTAFLIAMENPNEPSLDIGKNSYEMRTVKRSFDYALQVLQNEIYRHGQFNALPGSILGTIIQADSNLVKRVPPKSFGKQYEMRRDEEANKKRAAEAAKNIRQNGTNEPPYKRWRGRTNQAY